MIDVEKIPHSCGVYLFLDVNKNPLYIGKAKDLNKRIRSHLQNSDLKTHLFLRKTEDIEYIITNNEIEALLLEDTLIKRFKPKYNIRLKDDKKYPFIKVTTNEEFPRIIFTRKIDDKGIYFGPYTDAKNVRRTLRFLSKIFPLRDCKGQKLPKKECLNYHIGRCSGPCIGKITKDDYNNFVNTAIDFLKGNTENVERFLESKMWEASEKERFEEAAKWRDLLSFLNEMKEGQNVLTGIIEDFDVIGYAMRKKVVIFNIFRIRRGKIQGKKHSLLRIHLIVI
uniref:Excinuclease ABC subunit C n=1 Tax=candidate division WOR-3 bacterium TaxID=2052148 RepID=A0A7C4YFA5_UNCW3